LKRYTHVYIYVHTYPKSVHSNNYEFKYAALWRM